MHSKFHLELLSHGFIALDLFPFQTIGQFYNCCPTSSILAFVQQNNFRTGQSAAQVNLRFILGSGGQIIHHNDIIWVSNERLRLFILSFTGPNIARICAGQLQVRISKNVVISFLIFISKNNFVNKKIGNQKTKPTPYYISFKSCLLGGLS